MRRIGAVVIGETRATAFGAASSSLRGQVAPIVYVNSGSTDGRGSRTAPADARATP